MTGVSEEFGPIFDRRSPHELTGLATDRVFGALGAFSQEALEDLAPHQPHEFGILSMMTMSPRLMVRAGRC